MSLPSPVEVDLNATITHEEIADDEHKLCNSSCFINCCGRSVVKQEQSDNSTNEKVVRVAKKEGCCVIL